MANMEVALKSSGEGSWTCSPARLLHQHPCAGKLDLGHFCALCLGRLTEQQWPMRFDADWYSQSLMLSQ